jgi:hypothetical protein
LHPITAPRGTIEIDEHHFAAGKNGYSVNLDSFWTVMGPERRGYEPLYFADFSHYPTHFIKLATA